ncbi:unnamed protein product [Allacma fusca]|uniref:G-protein coupled receptors family 2 profile 2 domain-containing protein n=1 Tax=Allacma fusca TaxID=39272 RepID=A0A8J2K2S6_9HEXA|nr:unnamed protein product [Allacma fusca]
MRNASVPKICDANGTWAKYLNSHREWTNYSTCSNHALETHKKKANVHVMAYTVSIIALIPALIIFFSYSQLRVHRIILHQNLFISFLINGLFVIAVKTFIILNDLNSDKDAIQVSNQNTVWCRLLFIMTKYSRLTNYMWMFCEGYYLHKLIAAAFAEQESLLVFYLIGWVFPIIPTAIYAGLRLYDANEKCWVIPEETYEWVVNIPSLLSLLANLGFTIHIIYVLVMKLRASHSTNEPSQYRVSIRRRACSSEYVYALQNLLLLKAFFLSVHCERYVCVCLLRDGYLLRNLGIDSYVPKTICNWDGLRAICVWSMESNDVVPQLERSSQ